MIESTHTISQWVEVDFVFSLYYLNLWLLEHLLHYLVSFHRYFLFTERTRVRLVPNPRLDTLSMEYMLHMAGKLTHEHISGELILADSAFEGLMVGIIRREPDFIVRIHQVGRFGEDF